LIITDFLVFCQFNMKKTINILTFLLFTLNVLSQNSYEIKFKENSKVSDKKGNPNNVETNYLPIILSQHTRHYMIYEGKTRWIDKKDLEVFSTEFGKENIKDSLFYNKILKSDQKWFSRYLYEFDEPVLYNYYLGEDIIRLTYLRSFDKPIMIKLSRQNDSTSLNIKLLNNQIDVKILDDIFHGNYKTISDPKRLTELKENINFKIEKSTFLHLDSIIQSTNIKVEIPDNNDIKGQDGSNLLLEIHTSDGYYYIKRMNPNKDSAIWRIADYLIKTIRISEKIY